MTTDPHSTEPAGRVVGNALPPRLAIVHEWVAARTGSELVFEAMAEALPSADLYSLTAEAGVLPDWPDRPIVTSFLDRPRLRSRRSVQLPLMPVAWRVLARRREYDLVLSSSHAFSRVFAERLDCAHFSYVHAPMRYAWTPEVDGRSVPVVGAMARSMLRRRDLASTQHVTAFAANSRAVRERIQEFYDRDATVIPPPVDVEYFSSAQEPKEDFVLAASRWIPYKRLDLAIAAAAANDVRIKIAGSGPEERRLREFADQHFPNGVEFIRSPDRRELRRLMSAARAFVFPANEDFGIIAVEAQATGTPVVGLATGGTLDTVVDGVTGVLSPSQSVSDMSAALAQCLADEPEAASCREHAMGFSRAEFARRLEDWLTADRR